MANYQISYRFQGVSAHATMSPELGRSALDALELMNVGVQFLREHVPTDTRIHYAITDTGAMPWCSAVPRPGTVSAESSPAASGKGALPAGQSNCQRSGNDDRDRGGDHIYQIMLQHAH